MGSIVGNRSVCVVPPICPGENVVAQNVNRRLGLILDVASLSLAAGI